MKPMINGSWSARRRLVIAVVCLTLLLLISIVGSAQTVKVTPDSVIDPAKPTPVVLHVTKADGSTIDTDVISQVNSISVGNQPKVPFTADAQKGNITFTPPPNLSGPQTVQLLDKDGKPLRQVQLTYASGGASVGGGRADAAPTPCPAGQEARVVSVKPDKGEGEVQIGDVIDVQVENYNCLQALARAARPERNIVLFLDDMPVLKGTAYPPTDPNPSVDPKVTTLKFTLRPTYKPEEGARDVWTTVLGSPSLTEDKTIRVSIGIEDQFAIPVVKAGANEIKLNVVPAAWFAFWLILFGLLIVGFFLLARKTELLRDDVPPPGGGERRPFSLARTQAAWWFFLVVAAYLFIGIITGDFLTSFTATALGLLGISAGTTLGSAFVDAGKAQSPDLQAQEANSRAELLDDVKLLDPEVRALQADVKLLDTEVLNLRNEIANLPTGTSDPTKDAALASKKAELTTKNAALATKNAELATKKSQLNKLNNVSENPLRDILSDANGVSFHRFQMMAWSLVLGVIFAVQVYRVLAMPKFDSTLLMLLGISAGTFVGLKIPESTDPTGKK